MQLFFCNIVQYCNKCMYYIFVHVCSNMCLCIYIRYTCVILCKWNPNARLLSYIAEGILMKKLGVYWMYRRRIQRRVTSRCRRGPTVCWRNTSVSGVPRTDLRTGSCNHPRSSSPPSQFTLKRISPGHLSLYISLSLSCSLFHYVPFCIICLLRTNIAYFLFSPPFPPFFIIGAILLRFSFIRVI